MNHYVDCMNRPPAIGQVVVMAFAEELNVITSLDNLQTVLIIQPHAHFSTAYYKFPGGMLRDGETFEQAAVRELAEETGVVASTDSSQLVRLFTDKKAQHAPHVGIFDVALFAAFGCSFKDRTLVELGESGDEGEESALAYFGSITKPEFALPIASQPGRVATMFPYHLQLLETVRAIFAPA